MRKIFDLAFKKRGDTVIFVWAEDGDERGRRGGHSRCAIESYCYDNVQSERHFSVFAGGDRHDNIQPGRKSREYGTRSY